MLVAIYAIVALQSLILVVVFLLVAERLASNLFARQAAARRRRFEPHILNLLLEPSNIGPIRDAVHARDKRTVKRIMLQQAEQLKGEDKNHMTEVFEQLGFVKEEINKLGSKRWWRRLEAAVNLGNMHSYKSVEPLVRTVTDPIEDVRLAAVRSLGQLGETQGLGILLDAMEDEDLWTGSRIMEILIGMGPEIEPEIVSRLSPTNGVRSRKLYAELSGHLRILQAVDPLNNLAMDEDVEVRRVVAEALGRLGHHSSVGKLSTLAKDECALVRAEAVAALGRLGGEVVKQVVSGLSDVDWQVRRNAAASLSILGDDGERALKVASHSDDLATQEAASYALALKSLGLPVTA